MDLVDAVRRQLRAWGLEHTAQGAAALDVAARLTDPRTRAASAAMLHARLRDYLADLASQAPPEIQADMVTDLEHQVDGLRAVT